MKTIESKLRAEKHQLEIIIKESKKRLQKVPEGHLRIIKKGKNVEYYHKNAGLNGRNGKYIRKAEVKLAKELAQRDYDVHVVKTAEERLKAINTFLNKYEKTSLTQLYHKTHQCRRELITADIISDEEYIKRWQAVEYKGRPFVDDLQEIITDKGERVRSKQEIITDKGERVRSKSEKIIADKLYALGIPYRYEFPIILEGHIKIYPDFMILRMPDREEVYLEHFGMMDDENYVNNVIHKLDTYQRNGIYLGVNLFITHETGRNPLNTRALEKLIRQLFCSE